MPITTKHGSIFDSKAQVLVCPVNCVGVMGKGLALEFRKREPHFADWYMTICFQDAIRPGETLWCPQFNRILAATKGHWKWPTEIDWIDNILHEIEDTVYAYELPSIAIPQLGCGCGGLDWADVWPLYEKHLGGLGVDVEVWIHE